MYNLGEYTRMKINVLHCIICSGWVLLLFCPAIISQTKHFLQKNSSTQINLGEGEGTYSFSSENINCTLTSFFLCSMFNEWSSVGCHNGKSPHEEYFAQLGEKLFKEWSSKTTKEPNLQRGCKQANFGRNAGKWAGRESCSLLYFSQIPFYTFLPNTNTQIQKYKYTSTNIEIQMHKWVGRESFSLLQFS